MIPMMMRRNRLAGAALRFAPHITASGALPIGLERVPYVLTSGIAPPARTAIRFPPAFRAVYFHSILSLYPQKYQFPAPAEKKIILPLSFPRSQLSVFFTIRKFALPVLNNNRIPILFAAFWFLAASLSLCQSADSALAPSGDTLFSRADTIQTKSDVDSVVYSEGKDSLVFFVAKKKMNVYGKGDLKYKDTQLKSSKIFVDFSTNNVDAEGRESDSVKGKLEDTPVLSDKGEEYKGSRMRYNFKTTRGYITFAATKADEASYSGAKINKVDKTTFFVENGLYTTCDNPEPHFCFLGHEMKVIQKEQLVARWIWLTFERVPFPIPIPFAVVPLQHGRRSGLIAPAYGDRPGYGKYFSHLGYFWAISDYMDINATTDLYTKGGYSLQSRYRYAKRYEFSGLAEGSYSSLQQNKSTDPDYAEQKDWRLRVIHNHVLTPDSRFDVNMEFMSGSYFKQNTTDYNQLLRKEIYSNASYFTSWDEAGTSLSLNYNRRQDIESGDISERLPSMSFSKSQFYPFRPKGSIGDQHWYEMLGLNYSGQLENRREKQGGQLEVRGGVQHSVGFGFSPKVGYFNISPSFSYRELWYDKMIEKTAYVSAAGTDSIVTDDIHRINFVRTFSTGVSASTKLYGIFQPMTAGIAAMRHIISPSLSYNFTPDFSKPGWGYYGAYRDVTGREVKYSKHEREIFGGASGRESQSLSFGIDNNFEMKTMVDPTDTTSKEQKFQLMNISGDIGYDFTADSLRFSDIRIGYRTQIGQFLSLSGSSSYSLYDYTERGTTINTYLLKSRKRLARMNNFSFSFSFNLSGDRGKRETGEGGAAAEQEPVQDYFPQENRNYRGLYETVDADFSIPWSVSLNYNYSLSRYNPLVTSIYSNVSGNVNMNITQNWKLTFSGSYDITNKQFAAPQVVISRDLHCWIMNFTWRPVGTYTGYRFEIRVKAPQLQDVKVTKSNDFFSGRR